MLIHYCIWDTGKQAKLINGIGPSAIVQPHNPQDIINFKWMFVCAEWHALLLSKRKITIHISFWLGSLPSGFQFAPTTQILSHSFISLK